MGFCSGSDETLVNPMKIPNKNCDPNYIVTKWARDTCVAQICSESHNHDTIFNQFLTPERQIRRRQIFVGKRYEFFNWNGNWRHGRLAGDRCDGNQLGRHFSRSVTPALLDRVKRKTPAMIRRRFGFYLVSRRAFTRPEVRKCWPATGSHCLWHRRITSVCSL